MCSVEGNGSPSLLSRIPHADPQGFPAPWAGGLAEGCWEACVLGQGEGGSTMLGPSKQVKPGEFFTKQCQEGTVPGGHRTQRDPKKSSFLVGA